MSFLHQIELFRSAEVLVAPTGSGLCNMTWMNPGSTVIELGDPNQWVATEVISASKILNLRYHYIEVEGLTPRGKKSTEEISKEIFLRMPPDDQ